MRAPDFWRRNGLFARILSPASRVYWAFASRRGAFTRPVDPGVPVICVGNLVAGGAGKTPVALAMGAALADDGIRVNFLTRGYGGREHGPLLVSPSRHDAEDVGDEALLLARIAPTWVARDRAEGAEAAAGGGAEVIVMDDGHQNPSLVKSASIVVVDGGFGFGNGRLLPAGPLREPIEDGLARADAIVLIEPDERGVARSLPRRIPCFRARVVPAPGIEVAAGTPVAAFAGIGRPEKFFRTLRELGCEIVYRKAFPDHHRYRETEVMAILDRAASKGAIAVTTAKDAVRLPDAAREMVEVLDIALEWENPAVFDWLISRVVFEGDEAL